MKLEGKSAIVTGGGRGIGRVIALGLAKEGADVLVFSRTFTEAETTAAEIRMLGRRGIALRADVRSPDDISEVARRAINEFGQIDILVNNAGIQGPIGLLAYNDVNAWIQTIHTYLVGTFLSCRAVLPHMMARRQGKIINLSGGGAATSRPRFSAYAASKAGVVRLTEVLADEVMEFNIQVNAIAPGIANTRMIDEVLAAGEDAGTQALAEARGCKETGGTPLQKAADLVVFLSSSDSDGLTGRLISAVWDNWAEMVRQFPRISEVGGYTLRRLDQHSLNLINPDWILFKKES
jgi:NAD(P)-dependent dehydrogenase (short-subunit alcohol dehydrogenase family)